MKNYYLFVFLFFAFSYSCFSQQNTVVLKPGPEKGKDANVWSVSPNHNEGQSKAIIAMVWTWDGEFGVRYFLLDFDLGTLPPVDKIISAKLSLFYHYLSVGAEKEQTQYGENFSVIRRIISPWDEDEVTWNKRPSTTDLNQVLVAPTTDPRQDVKNIDVTSLVRDMLTDPDNSYGFSFRIYTEEIYRRMAFASSDHPDSTKWPELVVTYQCDNPTTAGFDKSIENGMYQFTDTSQNATSWYWDFGDGYFSTVQNPKHAYFVDDTVQVCLTVTGDCGTDTHCEIFKPSLVSVDQKIFDKRIVLFPNPAQGSVSIRAKGVTLEKLSVGIFTALGLKIKQVNFSSFNSEILLDISGFSSGVYYVHLKSGKSISVKKLIVY